MKYVKLGDMLTDAQIQRCCELYPDNERIRDEVIKPNLAAINARVGQENDASYIAYAVLYAIARLRSES